MAVAVYNHYKRAVVGGRLRMSVEIEKSNMLMIGPYRIRQDLSGKDAWPSLLDVPLAIADATSLTEAGYIGDDIESVAFQASRCSG